MQSSKQRLASIVLALGITLVLGWAYQQYQQQRSLTQAGIFLLPTAMPIPQTTLIDTARQPFNFNQLKGHWSLVFFGYTFCPDICPSTLADLRLLKKNLPAAAQSLQLVFVSIDPTRDTAEHLRTYLDFFQSNIIGLSGSAEVLQALSNSMGLGFIPADTQKINYTIDHSPNIAILNPEGIQIGLIQAPLKIAALSSALPKLMRRTPE